MTDKRDYTLTRDLLRDASVPLLILKVTLGVLLATAPVLALALYSEGSLAGLEFVLKLWAIMGVGTLGAGLFAYYAVYVPVCGRWRELHYEIDSRGVRLTERSKRGARSAYITRDDLTFVKRCGNVEVVYSRTHVIHIFM